MEALQRIISRVVEQKASSTSGVKNPNYNFIDAKNLGLWYSYFVQQKTKNEPTWTPKIIEIGNRVKRWLENPNRKPWLLLSGNVGTGKSTMMRAIAATIAEDKRRAVPTFVTAKEYALKNTEEQERITQNIGVVLMDDVGLEATTTRDYGTLLTPFATFIISRYALADVEFKMNIISTNCEFAELEEKYDIQVADRLLEMCEVIEFKQEKSFRKN